MHREPMLVEGEEICRIDKRVPGTRIELILVLHYRSKKYEATITAVREGKTLVRQRCSDHLREADINAWAGTLVKDINKEFDTEFQGILRHELESITVPPAQAVTAQPVLEPVRDVDPAPVPEPPAPVQAQATALAPDDLMTADDIWEAKVESLNPRSDIASMLTVRKGTNGFAVHLRVEMGTDSTEQFGAVGTVPEVSDWLRKSDLAKAVVQRLGTEEPTAYQLGRRWAEAFTVPLSQFHLRITEPHLFWSDDERKQRRLTYPRT